MLVTFTILSLVSTTVGGLVALRYRDKPHLILGFTAGVLLAVVSFEIFPELIRLVGETSVPVIRPMIALVVGFLFFHVLEKMFVVHAAHEDSYKAHRHPAVGMASALALSGHSFLDGVGIGLGFQVSEAVGLSVAIAVIAHDFSDGLNTVSLMLINKNSTKKAFWFLVIDAVAPVLGVVSTLFFQLPPDMLVLYLGFFAGFLLYIGVSDILPEAHHSNHSSLSTLGMTVLGVVLIFFVSQFAHSHAH